MSLQTAYFVEKRDSVLPQAVSTAKGSGKEVDIRAEIATASMATIQDEDERLLTRIGYKQVDLTVACIPLVWSGLRRVGWRFRYSR